MSAYDVAAIVEAANRRERGLKAGSTHIPLALRPPKGPRADADSPNDRPELRWPSERREVPRACWHCGAGGGMFEADLPHGLRKRGEIRCLLCSRVIVRLKADGTRPIPLADDEPRPRRGHPPKGVHP